MDPRFCEYEVKKLRSPACSRQENAIFPPHIHTTWLKPFSGTLYVVEGRGASLSQSLPLLSQLPSSTSKEASEGTRVSNGT